MPGRADAGKYVWFDAETKTPRWVETDITKDQMFRDMLEGIIAEVSAEDIQMVRVMECKTATPEKTDKPEESKKKKELLGEPQVIESDKLIKSLELEEKHNN